MSEFHLLLEDQLPHLLRYAVALTRDEEQASDLVYDTLVEALKTNRRWDRGHWAGSLDDLRVQLLTLLHEQRANPFRLADPLADASSDAIAPDAELSLSDLDRAMAQITEAQRAAILLIGLEGLTYRQTATVMGLSIGAMRAHLTRGRDALRQALGVADAMDEAA